MTKRSTALVFGGVAVAIAVTLAMAAGEIALRLVDGAGFGVRLRPPLPAPAAVTKAPAALDPNGKWLGPSQAEAYVRQLPIAAGVDPAWFAIDPDQPLERPADPELDARFAANRGFELSSVYEWNEAYITRALCVEPGLQQPVFSHVRNLFVFRPTTGDIYPQFRFFRGIRYKSGLRTNQFGWRGPEIDLVKPPATVRVAFVGASTTIDPHGDPFSYPEYVGRWLAEWARARRVPVRFEAINAGREGIDAPAVRAIVEQELVPVRPDLVIDNEGGNQFWPANFVRGELPPRPTNAAEPSWRLERYSALAVRTHRAIAAVGAGAEPRKPALVVDWPADLDERDPPLGDPRLPTSLPQIVRSMDEMRAALAPIGGTYIPSSFVWLVKPGLVLNRQRDAGIYRFLNVTYWPFSYAHMRRVADVQNQVFAKYAKAYQLPFVDVAAAYPLDPRLFLDAVHMTPAGIKLKAWLTFQQLVPEIGRRMADGRLPVPDPGGRTSHPAFAGPRRLVALDDLRRNCTRPAVTETRQ